MGRSNRPREFGQRRTAPARLSRFDPSVFMRVMVTVLMAVGVVVPLWM